MHGGARGSGAAKGNKNALKHGGFTREALAELAEFRELIAEFKKVIIE
jgi:glucans biosynthesis protein